MANNTGNKIGTEITVLVSGVPTAYPIPLDATVDDIVEITGLSDAYAQALFDNKTIENDPTCLPTCGGALSANEYPAEFSINGNTGESFHGMIIDVKTCMEFKIY